MFEVLEAVDTDRRLNISSKKALTLTMKVKKADFEGLRKLNKARTGELDACNGKNCSIYYMYIIIIYLCQESQ